MKTNLIAFGYFLLLLVAFGLAGTSDLESRRYVRGYYIAGVYK